jgi:citrate lyase subunit beta/citryl-CoA lyase
VRLRSLLFVPGDSERKFEKARGVAADVLILDLEDAVSPPMKEKAREFVSEIVSDSRPRDWRAFVRINDLASGIARADLEAVVRPGLDGVLLPKANGAEDVQTLAGHLDALEAAHAMTAGSVKIVVVSTETPRAMFNLGSYTPAHPRLAGLTWGAEDLSAAIGATDNKEPDGTWTFPYQVARSLCLFAAAGAGVAPIDTLYADFRDSAGLERNCRLARRDGFTGRIAIHPDQVAIINAAFSPSADELALARSIVDAFAAAPELGAIGLDGKMYDIPHLRAAQRTLAAAEETP